MGLIDRAVAFIDAPEPSELADLLNVCTADGSRESLLAVQSLYEANYEQLTFDYELKAPAALTLLRWGAAGLDALVEAALRSPKAKNVAIALDLLSLVATGASTYFLGTHWVREDLGKAILAQVSPEIREAARRRCSEMMLSLPDDEIAAMGMASVLTRMPVGNHEPAKLVFGAFAKRWIAVGEPTLQEFTRLLGEHASEEEQFQRFFERYPQLLDPMALEVWPQPDLYGFKKPDFVLRRSDDTYLIVEIETPQKGIITSARQLTAHATHAVSQATEYRRFLIERTREVRVHFPEFKSPDCLVVIGLEGPLDEDQRRALSADNESRSWLQVVGFDWLLSRAEAIASNTVNREGRVRNARIV